MLPLQPAHLLALRDGSGDITLSWLRRSRADSDAWSTDDAPADYLPERYRVTIYNGLSVVRTLEVSSAATLYTAAQQTAEGCALPEETATLDCGFDNAACLPGMLSHRVLH